MNWRLTLAVISLSLTAHCASIGGSPESNSVEENPTSVEKENIIDDQPPTDKKIRPQRPILFACPIKTFCIPRTRCSLQDVTYDREWLRFSKGADFQDEYGCGAIARTFTFVCCRTAKRLENDFSPTFSQWFYTSIEDVDDNSLFPPLLPWQNFAEDVPTSQINKTVTNTTTENKSSTSTTEAPKTQRPVPRSVTDEPQVAVAATNDFRQMWVNPWMNPWTMPFMVPPFMFNMPQPMMMANERMMNPMFNFMPFQAPLPFPMQPLFPTIDAFGKVSSEMEESPIHRARRSSDSDTFIMPEASGGLWTNYTFNETGVDGRALPTANILWKPPFEVPYFPIPLAYGVNNERCGMSTKTGINARIVSGQRAGALVESETSFAEFPWHAAILNGQTGEYLCAGTIISSRFILTVAHCVRKYLFNYLLVRVGDWDLGTRNEMFPSYDVEVVRIHVHEDFYAGNLQNDIALLQLKVPLDYSVMQHIGNICLPPVNGPVTYSNCIVTGWGQQVATSEAKGDTNTFSRLLRSVSQQLVTSDKCTKALRPFLGTFYQFPDKGFVCAYDSDGKDSCFGDGGGALACRVGANGYRKKDQYHVVGLVSWGVGCGLPNVPSAYTAVFDYNDWIRSKIASFDPYPDNSLPSGNNVVMVRSNPSSETSETTDYIDLAFPGTTK